METGVLKRHFYYAEITGSLLERKHLKVGQFLTIKKKKRKGKV